jgi:hypothetical protein
VNDRVDILIRENPADDGIADVSANELRAQEWPTGRDDIDADNSVDRGVPDKGSDHEAPEVAGCARDQHDATHGCLLLVAALNARALKQLAVLLLGHALAALLDHGAHRLPHSFREGPGAIPGAPTLSDRIASG